MSNVKVAPSPPDNIPTMAAQDGQISVAALESAMPVKTAKRLAGKVDLNRNGYLDAAEIGELFEDLEQTEDKNKFLMIQLVIAVVFLGVSIFANLGTAWYAVQSGQTTGSSASASSAATEMLTNKAGTPLRVDRSLDSHPMGSLLPDSAFQSLEYLSVTGPEGSLRMRVQATARFKLASAQYNSVVVVYTSLGSVEFDGTNMLMTDITADAFHRAGFVTTKSRRSDHQNPHGRFARDVSAIVGLFQGLSEMEMSQFSLAQPLDENGNQLIPFSKNPLAGLTDVYVKEEIFIACQGIEQDSFTDCTDGVVGVDLFEFEDAVGETHKYLKRTKQMLATMIEGKMMTYAETVMAEYGSSARLIDLSGEDQLMHTSWVETDNAGANAYYCDIDENATISSGGLPMAAGNQATPATKAALVITYAGNEQFFNTDTRKYWVHKKGQDPWDNTKENVKVAIYEHAVESRPFAVSLSPMQQSNWVVLGPATLAPAAFAARAAAHFGPASRPRTITNFFTPPTDCDEYPLEPTVTLVTNKKYRDAGAPAPLPYFRTAMIRQSDFKYIITDLTRMRRTALFPGEDGEARHRREIKGLFRESIQHITPRMRAHVFQIGSPLDPQAPVENVIGGNESAATEKFLEVFANEAVLNYDSAEEEDHHRNRRLELSADNSRLIEQVSPGYHMRSTRKRRTTRRGQCSETDSTACHPWGSGANTVAETKKQCGPAGSNFAQYADCVPPFSSTGPDNGYGWASVPGGNPWTCADDGEVCKNDDYDIVPDKLSLTISRCIANPVQFAATDSNGKQYMCPTAQQSFGLSVTGSFAKIWGVCTPSLTVAGVYGHDASCTTYGALSLTLALDCAVDMWFWAIHGGGSVELGLEIFSWGAQAYLEGKAYLAIGDKDDPWVSGSVAVKMSEWSFACCARRQRRLTVHLSLEVDLWWLSASHNSDVYNSKFGSLTPSSCDQAVLDKCDC